MMPMQYNLDEPIDRRGTDSMKWDALPTFFGRTDLTPFWVADMDFRTPDCVLDTLKKRLEHEVLGYTTPAKSWATSIVAWLRRKHGWEVDEPAISFVPGIVRGLAYALLCFTEKGDKVMISSPIYPPFFQVTERLEREVVSIPLLLKEGRYEMDFERIEQAMAGCKLYMLCNPHNPGGRVWSVEELGRLAEICAKHQVLIVSDEIHADLTLPPHTHRPFSTVSEEARARSIVFMSPSKAFNMAGLSASYAVIEDKAIRTRFLRFMEAGEFGAGHLFAYIATAAAYTPEGEAWLNQVLAYVQDNIAYVTHFLEEHLPQIKPMCVEASFLIFLDCRELGLCQKSLVKLFVEEARLALNDGSSFGKEGEGFMRLNVGCPRAELTKALQQLKRAVDGLA